MLQPTHYTKILMFAAYLRYYTNIKTGNATQYELSKIPVRKKEKAEDIAIQFYSVSE